METQKHFFQRKKWQNLKISIIYQFYLKPNLKLAKNFQKKSKLKKELDKKFSDILIACKPLHKNEPCVVQYLCPLLSL